ncbi:MAG: Carbon monoxide dehydrogenase/acetyl-CoA synthase subunit alpha [Chloroflexi bacterium]|nr:Carbon monoxide dehydrogenase/acetyl-CoA synthase subunit alpha [Chloroflexota bacterium]
MDEFYGCILCQAFAPTHICFITPDRMANCGAISWFDGRAAYKLDAEGPVFAVPKGELLDAVRGEYAGVNAVAQEKSLGSVEEVYLYSSFGRPHTSCGCFQSICFYIPEVDAFGLVYRDFIGESVIGLPFSKMAGETSGGRQVEGSCGMGLEYLRSPKFFQADGGLRRVVWMPKDIKERYKDAIPDDLYDKIATEEDVKNTDELTEFLERVGHPWVKGEVEIPD